MRAMGPESKQWTLQQVRSAADAFFADRNDLAVGHDLDVWTTQVTHIACPSWIPDPAPSLAPGSLGSLQL